MTSPYTVRLADADALAPAARIAAEIRFSMELERLLGGPDGVVAAWIEDYAAFEEWDATATPESPTLRTRWDQACEAASAIAAGEVAIPGAWFDVQMVSPAPAKWQPTAAPF